MESERNRAGEGTVDWAIAKRAETQRGIVTLDQLREAGLEKRGASHRAAKGQLHRLHRATYAVGYLDPGRLPRLLAAVLACGEGSVLSHGTAAALWGLQDYWPELVDVTVTCQAGRKLAGVRPHRCRRPAPEEVTVHHDIPCTTPSRTIVDLAGMRRLEQMRRVVERAAVHKLLDLAALDASLHLAKGRRGRPTLFTVLADWRAPGGETPDVRSIFEARLLPQIVRADLPRPTCNEVKLLGGERFELDYLWEDRRLVVETDGAASHGTPVAFQRDRRRDQMLVAAGYRVARITWDHATREPDATVARIRRMLEAWPPS